MLAQGCEVVIASSGGALHYLRLEFEELTFIPLPDLNVVYSKSERPGNWRFILKGVLNYPKLKKYVSACENVITEYLDAKQVDAILSDGHFGVRSTEVKSIILSHQLNLKTRLFGKQINQYNQQFLERFDEIWVPDFKGNESLAGELSENYSFQNVRYIGPITAYVNLKQSDSGKKHLLILLSGPEPQRQILQDKIHGQLVEQPDHFAEWQIDFVSGSSNASDINISGVNHHLVMNSKALNALICKSDLVICRSGYSSVMDLVALGKQAVLIPTPGQGEQEYLAQYHMEKGRFNSVPQREFQLAAILENSLNVSANFKPKTNSVGAQITQFLSSL